VLSEGKYPPRLCDKVNESRRLLINNATADKKKVIRFCFGQERSQDADTDKSWAILIEIL
jgi:hypothetical protein